MTHEEIWSLQHDKWLRKKTSNKIQFDVHTLYKGIKFIIMCQPPPPPYKIKNKIKIVVESELNSTFEFNSL